ncbi:hypothetical protein BGW80DRAFT_1275040 [Lactifluus volemus]|nr:hypothetical protein BGW80DRAFT_1275040 [Lactifluus volemus]
MPLDGHAFLINQGWSGNGSGLRQGAISRPITIPQKLNLSGIGNDRDDAFPFWDHVFSVAASAIQIQCFSSDDEDLRQTSTGILYPRLLGYNSIASSSTPRLSLLALSKRETARRALYSRFFRGPILGPDNVQSETVITAPSNDDDVHKSGKKKRKIETEDLDKEEQRRRKKLRKEAERAARKLNRRKEKEKTKRDGARPIEETTVLSASQQKRLGPSVSPTSDDERLQRKRKKSKNKQIAAVSIENELDSPAAVSVDDQHFRRSDHRDLERSGSSESSRKRHSRDRSP